MPLRHKIASFALAFVAVVLAASVAFAQVTPDTPDLSVAAAGHGKIRVTVTAGATGAPEGFEVCYMPAALFALHNNVWPANGWYPGEGWVDYTGLGTLNTWGSATVNFKLAPGEALDVEIGDAQDESGVSGTTTGELVDATQYVVCVYALPSAGGQGSPYSVTLTRATTVQGDNCTFTLGYWKNHTGVWPVSSLTLGTVSYNAVQLLSILNQSVGGNGLISLAHQLITAKLNIANGASPVSIAATITAADAMIGSLVVPPVGTDTLAPGTTSGLTQTLDDFNNGITGPGHCGETSAHPSTWGAVKSLYR
jgi:hypothetical protein